MDGFVIVTVVPAPPVYDPGGRSSLIDDFAVASRTDADILGDVADLLMDVKDAGDQRELTDAAQAKCADLMEPAGF